LRFVLVRYGCGAKRRVASTSRFPSLCCSGISSFSGVPPPQLFLTSFFSLMGQRPVFRCHALCVALPDHGFSVARLSTKVRAPSPFLFFRHPFFFLMRALRCVLPFFASCAARVEEVRYGASSSVRSAPLPFLFPSCFVFLFGLRIHYYSLTLFCSSPTPVFCGASRFSNFKAKFLSFGFIPCPVARFHSPLFLLLLVFSWSGHFFSCAGRQLSVMTPVPKGFPWSSA